MSRQSFTTPSPQAVRLFFTYDATGVRLESQQPVDACDRAAALSDQRQRLHRHPAKPGGRRVVERLLRVDWVGSDPGLTARRGATVTPFSRFEGHVDLFTVRPDGQVMTTWREPGMTWRIAGHPIHRPSHPGPSGSRRSTS